MADLIDRDAALEIVKRTSGDYAAAWSMICKLPTVDAEPVRHGRWIYDRMDVVCSHCKTVFKDEINFIQHDGYGRFVTAKRCPECGAKMDGRD